MRAKDELGRAGERAATRYLRAHGIDVLDRNWRCAAGELDIVARSGRTLIVYEVKTRSTDRYGGPLAAVGPAKRARLRRLAAQWLRDHHGGYDQVRIDVLGLTVRPGGGGCLVEHVRGVA